MQEQIVQMGWWDWVGVWAAIIGGVAFIMAAPSVLQMIWGRPQLQWTFDRLVEGSKRGLIIFLKNPPIKKGSLLDRLWVHRETIQSLAIQFRILEAGTGKILLPIHNARIFADDQPNDDGAYRIALPPTYADPSTTIIVFWDATTSRAIIPPDRLRSVLALGLGQYQAELTMYVDGTPQTVSKQFVVGQDADSLEWIGK